MRTWSTQHNFWCLTCSGERQKSLFDQLVERRRKISNCPNCGSNATGGSNFCPKCGTSLGVSGQGFLITTTPTVAGYKIKKVLGVVTGLTPRTRGLLGKFVAGIESMLGGEVTAFTTELEKARVEAVERVRSKAQALGANAIVGLDMETSDLGLGSGIVVISATGTAVILELE